MIFFLKKKNNDKIPTVWIIKLWIKLWGKNKFEKYAIKHKKQKPNNPISPKLILLRLILEILQNNDPKPKIENKNKK